MNAPALTHITLAALGTGVLIDILVSVALPYPKVQDALLSRARRLGLVANGGLDTLCCKYRAAFGDGGHVLGSLAAGFDPDPSADLTSGQSFHKQCGVVFPVLRAAALRCGRGSVPYAQAIADELLRHLSTANVFGGGLHGNEANHLHQMELPDHIDRHSTYCWTLWLADGGPLIAAFHDLHPVYTRYFKLHAALRGAEAVSLMPASHPASKSAALAAPAAPAVHRGGKQGAAKNRKDDGVRDQYTTDGYMLDGFVVPNDDDDSSCSDSEDKPLAMRQANTAKSKLGGESSSDSEDKPLAWRTAKNKLGGEAVTPTTVATTVPASSLTNFSVLAEFSILYFASPRFAAEADLLRDALGPAAQLPVAVGTIDQLTSQKALVAAVAKLQTRRVLILGHASEGGGAIGPREVGNVIHLEKVADIFLTSAPQIREFIFITCYAGSLATKFVSIYLQKLEMLDGKSGRKRKCPAVHAGTSEAEAPALLQSRRQTRNSSQSELEATAAQLQSPIGAVGVGDGPLASFNKRDLKEMAEELGADSRPTQEDSQALALLDAVRTMADGEISLAVVIFAYFLRCQQLLDKPAEAITCLMIPISPDDYLHNCIMKPGAAPAGKPFQPWLLRAPMCTEAVRNGSANTVDIILDDFIELAVNLLPCSLERPVMGPPSHGGGSVLPVPLRMCASHASSVSAAELESITAGAIVCLPGLLPPDACMQALEAAKASYPLPSIYNTAANSKRHGGDPNGSARVHGLRVIDYITHHRPELMNGRYQWGASWLYSDAGCCRQIVHHDFDMVKVDAHLEHPDAIAPATAWVSLEDGGELYVKNGDIWYVIHANAGDVVVFKGLHCGGVYASPHYRLHMYLDALKLYGLRQSIIDGTLVVLESSDHGVMLDCMPNESKAINEAHCQHVHLQ